MRPSVSCQSHTHVVDRHIFEHAIRGLLKDKLVILVTNNLHFLPDSDLVVYMDHGKIIGQGSFKKLKSKNAKFAELMKEFGIEKDKKKETQDGKGGATQAVATVQEGTGGKQYQAEEKEIGAVSADIYLYLSYFLHFRRILVGDDRFPGLLGAENYEFPTGDD